MALINDPDGLSQGASTSSPATTFASASGAQIVITSANVPAVTVGDFIEVRDALNSVNDGLYEVDAYAANVSITATKQALTGAVVNPVNDGTGQVVRIFGSDANEKNVHLDTTNRRITFLNGFGSTTVLDNEGVLGQAFYSFLKEEWKNDNDLIKFPFPMVAITPEQYEFVSGWLPVDEAESTISTTDPSNTRQLIRSAGWDEVDADGFIIDQYFGWVTLGNIDGGDNAYYFFESQSAATSATFDGAVNEAVQTIERADLSGAGTLAFVDGGGGNDSFTRTTGSFITDGFLVGDYLFIQNAEDAANDGSYQILTVGATSLEVATASFTANADDTTVIAAIDRRATPFTTRIRVFGKTYDQSTTSAIGVSSLTNQVYRFPLSEGTDNVIQDLVTTTVGDLFDDIITVPVSPYNDMTIAYFSSAQTRSGFNPLGGDTPSPGDAQFGVVIDGDVSVGTENGGGIASGEEIYAYVQAKLTETTDINDGAGAAVVTVIGLLAEPLLALASTGNTLSSLGQTSNPGGDGTGVKVDSFDSNDTNRVAFIDNDGDTRTFPFVASGTINFNANLSTDIDAIYRMFFTDDNAGDNLGRDFGTIDAITVEDNGSTEIAGAVPQQAGGSSQSFDFDYDGNVQRGAASAGVDAPITIVAIGLSVAQYVIATGTITRNTGQTFSLVAALERNFSNP